MTRLAYRLSSEGILVVIVRRVLGKVWQQLSDPRAAIPWKLRKGSRSGWPAGSWASEQRLKEDDSRGII